MTFIWSPTDPMTCVLGAIAMLMALILAWRGYRFLAREDKQRRIARERQGIDRDRPVVTCCIADERNSARAARRLRALGYRDVRVLKGGLSGWTLAGLPLEAKR